ncbi:MAG: transporter substrate-binding domain-containing protein, partial [Parazoarcus communis]
MLILAMCLLPLPAAAKAGLDDEARAYLARKPVISIGVVADNEPYSWVDGVEPAGFSIDVLEEIARQAGVSFSYRFGSWPEIYPAFMRGEIDAIDEISFRQDRAEKVLFTEPYHFRQT